MPPRPSWGAYIFTFGLTLNTWLRPAIWSEWRCDSTTKSRLVRSTPFAFTLVGEDIAVIAGVEQDSLTRHLDERREAPILFHCSVLAEGVVKNCDLPCARLCVARRSADSGRRRHHRSSRKKGMSNHR